MFLCIGNKLNIVLLRIKTKYFSPTLFIIISFRYSNQIDMLALIILWVSFFISHSLLAATSVKIFFVKLLKEKFTYYRLVYNLISLFFMALIVIQIAVTASEEIFNSGIFFQFMGGTLLMAGLYITNSTFKHIDFWSFLGLSTKEESATLVTEGWYKVVRHPLYWGTFLILNGIFFLKPTVTILLSVLLAITYIVIGIEFEEKKLRQSYGRAYDEYAFGKKKFIPFIY